MQTESRLLRYIICSQLFKSFIQTPSITESPHFPGIFSISFLSVVIMELITELRHDPHPDILHAIHVLHDTGLRFSPLLECIINEMVLDLPGHSHSPELDVEAGDIEHVPLINEMDFDVNSDVIITTTELQQEDEQLEAVLFNLLEEASVEDHFNRM